MEAGSDVRSVASSCGLLSAAQLELTEVDEATVLLERIANRQYSAVEVIDAYCGRAAIAHQLTNCLTEITFDAARAQAAKLDEHLQRTGGLYGPLHGLPISLKDQFDLEGVDSSIERNSVLVDLLQKLGAVIFCKTNVPQTMMSAETNNNIFGRTLNPRNRSLGSGGSSGGEGALLAMKGSIVGFGTDFGGSVRVPALANGLYGLRPTTRRLPYARVSNVLKGFEGIESTIGPLARSVDSLDVVMRAVIDAEPSLFDPKVIERPWITATGSRTLHVAFSLDNGLAHSHPPIRRALRETVSALRAAGHTVTELEAIDHQAASALFSRLAGADGGADLRAFLKPTGEPIVPEAFPFTSTPGSTVYELNSLQTKRDAFRQDFLELWQRSGHRLDGITAAESGKPFDVILCPVFAHLAKMHLGRPHDAEPITWTMLWSLLDLPACTLPLGEIDPVKDAMEPLPGAAFSPYDQEQWSAYSPEAHKNAPVVLQLVNPRRFREDELLGMVRIVEEAVRKRTTLSSSAA
ncbi:hypothetical protein Rhopal_006403-T1 [Rhodotorula paludigena]|uniref:amidase n=1 Tax=Rhodotorula paludigena TaxID=86838 RepID=A0AAV5GL50_9BASI|nr:hypothetical protein Rhopal_006403-T1 [Rhodotorula paludigena]